MSARCLGNSLILRCLLPRLRGGSPFVTPANPTKATATSPRQKVVSVHKSPRLRSCCRWHFRRPETTGFSDDLPAAKIMFVYSSDCLGDDMRGCKQLIVNVLLRCARVPLSSKILPSQPPDYQVVTSGDYPLLATLCRSSFGGLTHPFGASC